MLRYLTMVVTLIDKPGSLFELLKVIAENGANILKIEHDRMIHGINPNEINVNIDCEVSDKDHGDRLIEAIKATNHSVKIKDI